VRPTHGIRDRGVAMDWKIAAVANGVVAVAYLLIAWAIAAPLVRTQQLRSNKLGAATAAIFFTCAVHHGSHSVHMLLPAFGIEEEHGEAMRAAWDWHNAAWDVLTACVGVYYWTLRRQYGSLMRGAALFNDLKERERQALQLHDQVVQGLVVAKMALDLDQKDQSQEALTATLASASQIISDLIGRSSDDLQMRPGDLVRERPADLGTT
jgi:signal transduction histidine kinase